MLRCKLFIILFLALVVRVKAQERTYTNSSLAEVLRYDREQAEKRTSSQGSVYKSFQTEYGARPLTEQELYQIEKQKEKNRAPFIFKGSNGKLGLKNTYGEIFISPSYDDMISCYNGNFGAAQGGKWGVVNSKGEVIAPFKYEKIQSSLNMLAVSLNGMWGVLDPGTGKEMTGFKYSRLEFAGNGLFKFSGNGGTSGLLNAKGMELSSGFDEIFPSGDGYFTIKRNGKMGLVDQYGAIVVSPLYDYVSPGDPGILMLDSKWGYIGKYGSPIGKIIYDGVSQFRYGLGKVTIGGKEGYIDLNGNVVVPIIYDDVSSLYSKIFNVKKDGKWGIINRDGKILVPSKYDDMSELSPYGFAVVTSGGKKGVIDTLGKEVIPLKYNNLNAYTFTVEHLPAPVCIDGKWGLIDPYLSRELCPVKYDTISYDGFGGGKRAIGVGMKDKSTGSMKWGLIDSYGKIVIPIGYRQIVYVGENDCELLKEWGGKRDRFKWDFQKYKWTEKKESDY